MLQIITIGKVEKIQSSCDRKDQVHSADPPCGLCVPNSLRFTVDRFNACGHKRHVSWFINQVVKGFNVS